MNNNHPHLVAGDRRRLTIVEFTIALLLSLPAFIQAQDLTGRTAPDFTLPIWRESEVITLYDLKGSIIVLDFFAYWCGPCQTSSPDLEENVLKYYKDLGGTPAGIPVHVLPINIESSNPSQTDAFIESAGLSLALDDSASRSVFTHYSTGGIPLFVIINGVSDSPTHEPWEILHHQAGYAGSDHFRSIIESVEFVPLDPDSPPIITSQPPSQIAATMGESLEISVSGRAPGNFTYQWRNADTLEVVSNSETLRFSDLSPSDAGRYEALLTNENGVVVSQESTVFVRLPGPRVSALSEMEPINIPDFSGSLNFQTFTLQIDGVSENLRINKTYIDLDIDHSYRGDLSVELINPAGSSRTLKGSNVTDGARDITWQAEAFDMFIGHEPNGTWSLRIADNFAEDTGVFNSWGLTFELTADLNFEEWLSSNGLPSANAIDPNLDYNGNGFCLMHDYALDTAGSLIDLTIIHSGGTPQLAVQFASPLGRTDVQYRLQISEDMQHWNDLDFQFLEQGDTFNTFEGIQSLKNDSDSLFIRLTCSVIPEN